MGGGGFGGASIPGRPNYFDFMQLLGKCWQNCVLALPSPRELAPPRRGNPGSATVQLENFTRKQAFYLILLKVLTDQVAEFKTKIILTLDQLIFEEIDHHDEITIEIFVQVFPTGLHKVNANQLSQNAFQSITVHVAFKALLQ